MLKHQFARPILLLVALFFMSGCATTWVKRAPKSTPQSPQETLVASFRVMSQAPGEAGDVKALATLAQNDSIAKFGPIAQKKLEAALEPKGFKFTFDKPRAVKLGEASYMKSKSMTALSGTWIHPDTSPYSFNNAFFDSSLAKIAQTLKVPEKPQEHFASVSVYIHEGSNFSCGGIIGWFYPIITVDIRILNNRGVEVFNARFKGEGDSSFGVADRGTANLTKALDGAISQMKELKEKDL